MALEHQHILPLLPYPQIRHFFNRLKSVVIAN
jgi:hypothetical protein